MTKAGWFAVGVVVGALAVALGPLACPPEPVRDPIADSLRSGAAKGDSVRQEVKPILEAAQVKADRGEKQLAFADSLAKRRAGREEDRKPSDEVAADTGALLAWYVDYTDSLRMWLVDAHRESDSAAAAARNGLGAYREAAQASSKLWDLSIYQGGLLNLGAARIDGLNSELANAKTKWGLGLTAGVVGVWDHCIGAGLVAGPHVRLVRIPLVGWDLRAAAGYGAAVCPAVREAGGNPKVAIAHGPAVLFGMKVPMPWSKKAKRPGGQPVPADY